MRKWYVLPAALACAAAAAGVALASGHAAGSGSAVVKTFGGDKVVINKYVQQSMRFSPGTITVKSGSTLTLEYGDKGEQDPHTLTIVPKSQLPKTVDQINSCAACKFALAHLKSQKAPPGPGNPIVHWVLNKGRAGLDAVGDSVAIQPDPKHKSVSVKVSAKPGSTLYFFCAVHPWMQGKLVVK